MERHKHRPTEDANTAPAGAGVQLHQVDQAELHQVDQVGIVNSELTEELKWIC